MGGQLPSGEQFEISRAGYAATVTEVGATLRQLSAGGEALIDGFGPGEMASGGRGQVLMPWPNRLADGEFTFDGTRASAALDEPERHNAIHGLVRWAGWACLERRDDRVVMGLRLHPQPGYPFALDLALSFGLGPEGLTVRTSATNPGSGPLPFGAGFHPYLTVGTATVDEVVLQVPASSRLVTDDRGLPVGSEAVAGTPYDFREPTPVGALHLDTAFSDLTRSADGTVRVELDRPGGGGGLTLWADRSFSHLMCYSGDTLPEAGGRRRSLAVEPMTCAPNALRTGEGIAVLEPGERFSASWGLAARR